MVKKVCLRYCLLFLMLCIFLTAHSAWATSTGLNNIPTADVVPENVLVFQYYNEVGSDKIPNHYGAFKYGLMKNVEVGLDGRFFAEKSSTENLVGQAKYRFEVDSDLAIALGVANLGDRDKAGKEFPFGVLSYDTGFLRVHFGGTSQDDNKGFFGGLDKTFKLFERDFMFRADILQVNSQNDTLTSAGFIYDLGHNFLLESWMSFPSETGRKEYLTLKLNYVIRF
jgi:hypothetical protein